MMKLSKYIFLIISIFIIDFLTIKGIFTLYGNIAIVILLLVIIFLVISVNDKKRNHNE